MCDVLSAPCVPGFQMTGQLISVHLTYEEAERLRELLKDARTLAWKLKDAMDRADREREAWPS